MEDPAPPRSVGVTVDDAPLRLRVQRALERAELPHHAVTLQGPITSAAGSAEVDVLVFGGRPTIKARLDAIRALRSTFADAAIIVLAPHGVAGLRQTLDAGVCGVLPAPDVERALAATVSAVRSGLLVVPRRQRPVTERVPLSHREQQVLELLVSGCTNAVIGQRLYLAESTVKCHVKSIYSKLGVSTRGDATRVALDGSWLSRTPRKETAGAGTRTPPHQYPAAEVPPILPPLFAAAPR